MNENENIDIGNLELATHSKRIFAFIIDNILMSSIIIIQFWEYMQNFDDNTIILIMQDNYLQILTMIVLYHIFFVWYYGATLGKMVFKIKVIDFENFGKITFAQAILRSVFRIVSELVYYIGFIFSFFTQSRQTLHDKIAKTLVVNV